MASIHEHALTGWSHWVELGLPRKVVADDISRLTSVPEKFETVEGEGEEAYGLNVLGYFS